MVGEDRAITKQSALITITVFASICLSSCGQDTQKQSLAAMRNVIAVEGWVSSFQMKRAVKPEGAELDGQPEKHFYPMLGDLQKMLLEDKTVTSLDAPPLINPVTGKAEWPIEDPRPLKNYRSLVADRASFIGKGCVEFIPFVDGNDVVSGYVIRAGDPETGKVLCSNGMPYVRSSP